LPALIAGVHTEHQLIVPAANHWEASWVAGPRVRVARHLREVCEALRGLAHLPGAASIGYAPARARLDIVQVRGRRRISGPLIDRIDMHVELQHVPVEHLMAGSDARCEASPASVETSAAIAARVAAARRLQTSRQGVLNARLDPAQVGGGCRLDRESRALVAVAMDRLGLSARAYHRVLKLARTCADLAGAPQIRRCDVSEAIGLRALDRAPQGVAGEERYLASETM
jgi:predicted ATPase with chaperone activity